MNINSPNSSQKNLVFTLLNQNSNDREAKRGSCENFGSSKDNTLRRTVSAANSTLMSKNNSSNVSSRGSSDFSLPFSESDFDTDTDTESDDDFNSTVPNINGVFIEQITESEADNLKPRYLRLFNKDFPTDVYDSAFLVGVYGRDSWKISKSGLLNIINGIFEKIVSKIDKNAGNSFKVEAGPFEYMSRGGCYSSGLKGWLDVRKFVKYVDLKLREETGARIGECITKKDNVNSHFNNKTGSVVTLGVKNKGSNSLKQLCFEKILLDQNISSKCLNQVREQKEPKSDAQKNDLKKVKWLLTSGFSVVTHANSNELSNLLTRHIFNNLMLKKK